MWWVISKMSGLLLRMDKLEKLQAYQQGLLLDLQEDIQNLYGRSEGWPVEPWEDREFEERCVNDNNE